MGVTDTSLKKQKFFERARGLSPTTLAAIDRVSALETEVSGIDVEFTNNEVDHSMLVRLASAKKTPALLKIESSGRLMLMTALQSARPAIQNALGALAEKLGARPRADWQKTKPAFVSGQWEARTDAIVDTIVQIARDGE